MRPKNTYLNVQNGPYPNSRFHSNLKHANLKRVNMDFKSNISECSFWKFIFTLILKIAFKNIEK